MDKETLIRNLIEERKNFLSYLEYRDEECSFPSSDFSLEKEAIEQLKKEGKIR